MEDVGIFRALICGHKNNNNNNEIMSIDGESQFNLSTILLPSLGARSNRRIKLRPFIISPHHKLYKLWGYFLVFLVGYTAGVCPFEFGFLGRPKGGLAIADNIVNGFFAIDIILTFFVAYVDKVTFNLIDDRRRIAMNYVKGGFILDVLSSIPSELAIKLEPACIKPYGYTNVLRLWRLHRVNKLFSSFEKDTRYDYITVRCVKLLFVTFLVVHLAGCLMFHLASLRRHPSKSWLGSPNSSFKEQNLWMQYVTSVYWAISTLTTVGYGDLHPVNQIEMVADILFMLFNLAFTSYIIGNMTHLAVQQTRRTRDFRDKIEAASKFALRNQLPTAIKDQMIEHFLLRYQADAQGLQQETLDALPKGIRSNVSCVLFYSLVENTYLFRGVSSETLLQLVPEMKPEYFPPREDVILQNETPTDFYILVNGVVELLDSENGTKHVVNTASRGDLFGEIGVLCYRPQLFTVRTKRLTQLLRINRVTLLSTIQANVNDGTKIMNNLLQHLKERDEPMVKGILAETENMLARGKVDLPLTLSFAIIRGDDLLLHQLLRRGIDPNECDKNGRTALHIAVAEGSENCVALLLDYGANPNSKDKEGNVPLWEAIVGKHESIIKKLKNNGGKLSSGDVGQFACTAVEQNDLNLLKRISEYGGDLNIPRADGNTALHSAVCEGNIEIVKYLLEKGADLDKHGIGNWTPRDLAIQQCHEDIIELFESKKVSENHSVISIHPARNPFVTGYKSEPSIHPFSQSIRSRSEEVFWSGNRRRRETNTFRNSLFGIVSAAKASKKIDDKSVKSSATLVEDFSQFYPTRVTISCPEKGHIVGKVILLPKSLEEVIRIGAAKFGFLADKVLLENGAEIDELGLIRDGDHLLLVSNTWFDTSNNKVKGL